MPSAPLPRRRTRRRPSRWPTTTQTCPDRAPAAGLGTGGSRRQVRTAAADAGGDRGSRPSRSSRPGWHVRAVAGLISGASTRAVGANVVAVNVTWRALTIDDAADITVLNNLVAAADGTGEVTTEQATAESFTRPRFDPEYDTAGMWHDGTLVGAGSVSYREELVDGRALMGVHGHIHPDHRGRGLGARLLTWLQDRAITLARERFPGAPIRLRTSGGQADSSAQRLLEAFGYTPDNYFITMEADLTSWVDPGTPTTAVAPGPADRDGLREAHNDAFRDHRNHSPISADSWSHFSTASTLRPELSRIVRESGRVLAYAVPGEYPPGLVHIALVGPRREARGRGLAKDVLVAALRAARDAGYRTSELEVDSTSPTGADRLYRSVGYEPVRVISRYIRDVS